MIKEVIEAVMEFAEEVKERLYEIYPNATIRVARVVKNNDENLVGITIFENGNAVAPQVYVNGLYMSYIRGQMDMDDIIGEVQDVYNKGLDDAGSYKINQLDFCDKDKILHNLVIKLLGKDNNIEFLTDATFIDVLPGLVAVFYILVGVEEQGILLTKLEKHIFDRLDISLDEAYEIALNNTVKNFPVKLASMQEMLPEEYRDSCMNNADVSLNVLTNSSKLNGATAILYPDVIKDFAKAHGLDKVIILPSSIHELILLEYDEIMLPEDIKHMVEDVNNTVLSPDEILSNNVYIYDADTNQISLFE